jgi:hypothetical protein
MQMPLMESLQGAQDLLHRIISTWMKENLHNFTCREPVVLDDSLAGSHPQLGTASMVRADPAPSRVPATSGSSDAFELDPSLAGLDPQQDIITLNQELSDGCQSSGFDNETDNAVECGTSVTVQPVSEYVKKMEADKDLLKRLEKGAEFDGSANWQAVEADTFLLIDAAIRTEKGGGNDELELPATSRGKTKRAPAKKEIAVQPALPPPTLHIIFIRMLRRMLCRSLRRKW